MKAVSLGTWVDMTDGYEYRDGEAFPHDGREIPEKRLKELSTADNNTGTPVISIIEEPSKKTK